jgi:hypothetical protein
MSGAGLRCSAPGSFADILPKKPSQVWILYMRGGCKMILNALVERLLGKCLQFYGFRGSMGKLTSTQFVVDCRDSGSRLAIPDGPGANDIVSQRRSV